MLAGSQLNQLAERRRLLVMEADLQRALIALECENLRAKWSGVAALRQQVASASPLLAVGAAVAGLLAVRHRRKLGGWLAVVPTVLRLARLLKAK
jgi:hypothetical protein